MSKDFQFEMNKFEREISGLPPPSSTVFMPPQLRKTSSSTAETPPPMLAPPKVPEMPPPRMPGPIAPLRAPLGHGPNSGMAFLPRNVGPTAAATLIVAESKKKSRGAATETQAVFESPSIPYVGAQIRKMRAEVRADRRRKRKEEKDKFLEAKKMRLAGIEPPKPESKSVAMDLDDPNQVEQGPSVPPGMRKRDRRKRIIRTAAGEVWEDPTLGEWPWDDFRMFCGDLGNEVTDEVLARAFSQYPSFQKAKVCRDKKSNKTKGFGFVSFRDADDFMRAMREMNGKYVGNRPIKLRKSNWQDRNLDEVHRKMKEKAKLGFR